MQFTLIALLLALALFLCMLMLFEIGRRHGLAKLRRDPDYENKGSGATEGAVFALLGLVIAFTFSGAGSRFEARRALITEEANDIGTAYLRIDLLAADAQPAVRHNFRRYAELRASPPSDPAGIPAWGARTAALQETIWAQALSASQSPDAAPQATMLMLPALNAMIDITTTRYMATRNHPHFAIYILLVALSLVGALLVGHNAAGNKTRNWLQPMVFAGVISLSLYLILELEFPRAGLVRVTGTDQVLADVRASMR